MSAAREPVSTGGAPFPASTEPTGFQSPPAPPSIPNLPTKEIKTDQSKTNHDYDDEIK